MQDLFDTIEMGLGTAQWGDRLAWGYGRDYSRDDVQAAFDAGLAAGLRLFDTAEIYGLGRSERFLGEFMRRGRDGGPSVVVATKFMPLPWRWQRADLLRALRQSLKRLGLRQVDLYQMHWPFVPVRIETWMEAMADAVEAGLARAVGVSNYDREQTQRAFDTLARRGVPLASNQVPYSLLDRRVESNGLLSLCRELGVTVIAYSPLAMGLLSGKYTPANPLPGRRRLIYHPNVLVEIQPLIACLREIGAARGGRTPAQVALNWVTCKGAVPIPGVKTAHQVEQNAGALGWRLTAEEVTALDEVSARV